MPSPCGFSSVSASRVAWRTTSWFDSTQVLGAPTAPNSRSDSSIVARICPALKWQDRYGKLNAWCISSGRTHLAIRDSGLTQASAHSTRSPPYSSNTVRQSR